MHHEHDPSSKELESSQTMPKWESGIGRKPASATAQNDTGQRAPGDGSDKHRARQEKCDELRRARVGAADAEVCSVCGWIVFLNAQSGTNSMPPSVYALHDSRHDAIGM
jgi:hypothetical protein